MKTNINIKNRIQSKKLIEIPISTVDSGVNNYISTFFLYLHFTTIFSLFHFIFFITLLLASSNSDADFLIVHLNKK